MAEAEAHLEEMFCPTCERSFPGGDRCPEDGAPLMVLRTRPDPFVGKVIDGRFAIERRIASGGMGTVYCARQVSVAREVALKIIHQRHVDDPTCAKRFLREARIASSLSHPNTVSVFDFGQSSEGVLYIVMELLQGRTLADVLAADGPFAPKRAAWIGVQICDALEAAHVRKVVHRDLKPGNIMVLDEPRDRDIVKVLDFGLAKSLFSEATNATRTDQIVGTPAYMAPELMHGDKATLATDVYALGAMLFELLTGNTPKGIALDADALFSALTPPFGQTPASFANAIVRMLSVFPNERPTSAAAVREAIIAAMEQTDTPLMNVGETRGELLPGPETSSLVQTAEPVMMESVSVSLPRSPWFSKGRVIAVIAALGALLLVVLAVMSMRPRDTNEATRAPRVQEGPVPIATSQAPRTLPNGREPPQTVEVVLSSQPGGAEVRIDGAHAGRTPLRTSLQRSETPVRIDLVHRGYRTATQTVVPDRDHTVSVALQRTPRAHAPREEFIVPDQDGVH